MHAIPVSHDLLGLPLFPEVASHTGSNAEDGDDDWEDEEADYLPDHPGALSFFVIWIGFIASPTLALSILTASGSPEGDGLDPVQEYRHDGTLCQEGGRSHNNIILNIKSSYFGLHYQNSHRSFYSTGF